VNPPPGVKPLTVYEAFVQSAVRCPRADFLDVESVTAAAYRIAPGVIAYQDAADRIEALRRRYAAAGYGHGHRVGLLLENRPAFYLHWFALNALGASVVPISAEMRKAEWLYLMSHSEMCLAISLPERVAALAAAGRETGLPFAVALPEGAADLPAAPFSAPDRATAIGLQTECALLYTSGTTGRPKGCRLSNAYYLNCGDWYVNAGGLCSIRPGSERVITPLPLSHMNAMACSSMMAVLSGGCIVQLDRFHPTTWWQSVRESGASVVHYLGVMPAMLLSAAPSAADRQHQVRFGFGAGVEPSQHRAFEERFGFMLLEAWAMTETGAAATIIANREPRHVGTKCFGRPESFVDVRLVGEEGAEVPVDQPGELWVRAPGPDPRRHFFSGYLKDAAATEDAWAGGWFHTGDVVRRDAEGSLYFVDRKKNVIRRSGENISAVEVESVLNQHPAVRASAVAPTPDPVRGDEVLACIVTREPCPPARRAALAADLLEHALAQLAYYKAPGYVAFVDELPLTLSQKIQRSSLRELAQTLPDQPNCFDMRSLKKRQA
jgi:acyl-CoA synthetase (AMP-forming)/AMP-acid ligase II